MMADRCSGVTKEGKPCAAKPRPESTTCPWHSPDAAERRSAWSAKGGVNRSNAARARKNLPAELMTLEEVESYLGVVFRGVMTGKIEPGVGTAMSTIAKTMADLKRAAVEERLEELERSLGIKRIGA